MKPDETNLLELPHWIWPTKLYQNLEMVHNKRLKVAMK
jgi:hypothetical protein